MRDSRSPEVVACLPLDLDTKMRKGAKSVPWRMLRIGINYWVPGGGAESCQGMLHKPRLGRWRMLRI